MRFGWLYWVVGILAFIGVFVALILLLFAWRGRFPTPKTPTGPSPPITGASGPILYYFTGSTGPTGTAPQTGPFGPTGPGGVTGATGSLAVPNQIGDLNPTIIATIEMSATNIFRYAVIWDERTDFSVPAGLNSNMTSHMIEYNPFTFTWYDYGPWLGATGFPGAQGPQGLQGPTGFSGPGITGKTGPDGQQGFTLDASGIFDSGFAYGNGSDGDIVIGQFQSLSLTRDMFPRNIFNNNLIMTNGYRLIIQNELQNYGTISCDGGNGEPAALTSDTPTTTGGTAGGTAGGQGTMTRGGFGGMGMPYAQFPSSGDNVVYSFETNGPNENDFYPTPLPQVNLYAGGDASTTFPLGDPSQGGGVGGSSTVTLTVSERLNVWNSIHSTIQWPVGCTPLPVSGGGGGGAGFSNNTLYTAASGGGGAGVVQIAAARIVHQAGSPTGTISARGGNAGANASVTDVSGGGGGGGAIFMKTTTPFDQWGQLLLVNGGSPMNLNHGSGSPVNQPEAFGQPGQVLIQIS